MNGVWSTLKCRYSSRKRNEMTSIIHAFGSTAKVVGDAANGRVAVISINSSGGVNIMRASELGSSPGGRSLREVIW